MNKRIMIKLSLPCKVRRGRSEWTLQVFCLRHSRGEQEVACLTFGKLTPGCLVRINSPCITSEVFGDDGRCDCKHQLDNAFAMIENEGAGVILYNLTEEGRGNGLFNKVNSYHLMDRHGLTTRQAFENLGLSQDARDYEYAAFILQYFRLNSIRLMTNNPQKLTVFARHGIDVSRVSLVVRDERLRSYLESKQQDFNHYMGPNCVDLPVASPSND